jgi:hypothetical protein
MTEEKVRYYIRFELALGPGNGDASEFINILLNSLTDEVASTEIHDFAQANPHHYDGKRILSRFRLIKETTLVVI